MKFLLDENLSWETAESIRQLGYHAVTVSEVGLKHTDDKELVYYAANHGYILMTFDLDFGLLFRVFGKTKFGVIIFRLQDQTVESANKAVNRLLASRCLDEEINQTALVMVDEISIRVRREFFG